MNRLLRFPEATSRDPRIDIWLNKQTDELHSIARRWYARMRQCGDDVRELMHDGCPTACVEDAAFCYVGIYRDHVNVGFFPGTELLDPAGILEGTGKYMRHVKLSPSTDIDSRALSNLIDAAYLHMKKLLADG